MAPLERGNRDSRRPRANSPTVSVRFRESSRKQLESPGERLRDRPVIRPEIKVPKLHRSPEFRDDRSPSMRQRNPKICWFWAAASWSYWLSVVFCPFTAMRAVVKRWQSTDRVSRGPTCYTCSRHQIKGCGRKRAPPSIVAGHRPPQTERGLPRSQVLTVPGLMIPPHDTPFGSLDERMNE